MSSKVNAIYTALDSGNAKSAVKLCEQFFSKKPPPTSPYYHLVKALLAYGLSRMGRSEEARVVCETSISEGVDDPGAIETFGYVFKKEGWYDLHAKLTNTVFTTPEISIEILKDSFYANLQSGSFDQLAKIALKLLKMDKDSDYSLWYAFALSLSGEAKMVSMAVGLIDRALALPPLVARPSRWTCGNRREVYLKKFRLQLLNETFEETKIVSSDDLQKLRESSPLSTPLLITYLEASMDRADCMVVLSEFLPFLVSPQELLNAALGLRESAISGQSIVTLTKLIYGLDRSKINVSELIETAKKFIETEHVLDECSPGKQLLLLSAILLLEEGKYESATFILAYGSQKFTHCSHFRLIECIVYAHFGMTEKAMERFAALGIKNAQWRSLFWLISGIFSKFYISESVRGHVKEEIDYYLKRHRIEINSNLVLLVEELAFFKFDEFRKSVDISKICSANQWSQNQCPTEITGYDYSPLIFLSVPKVGSHARSLCPVSSELIVGKWIQPLPEESARVWKIRNSLSHFSDPSENILDMSYREKVYRAVWKFMNSEFSDSEFISLFKSIPQYKLFDDSSDTWLSCMGAWLNGPIDWILNFVESKRFSAKPILKTLIALLQGQIDREFDRTNDFEKFGLDNSFSLDEIMLEEFANIKSGCLDYIKRIRIIVAV